MKTLIINGSPRKNGDSITLIDELKKELKGDVIQINVHFDNIKSCCDCRFCWENTGCLIKDDMQNVYELLNEVDNVVLASPLYFFELTGDILNFASRLQMVYAQQYLRGNKDYRFKKKLGALILVGGGDGVTKPAEDRAKMIFNMMNVECKSKIFSLNTNTIPAAKDTLALNKSKELAKLFNK